MLEKVNLEEEQMDIEELLQHLEELDRWSRQEDWDAVRMSIIDALSKPERLTDQQLAALQCHSIRLIMETLL